MYNQNVYFNIREFEFNSLISQLKTKKKKDILWKWYFMLIFANKMEEAECIVTAGHHSNKVAFFLGCPNFPVYPQVRP